MDVDQTPRKKISTLMLIAIVIVLTLITGLLLSLSSIAKKQRMYLISSFEECKSAGYPIMESYPEQCRTPDGRSFVNDAQDIVPDTAVPIPVATSTVNE